MLINRIQESDWQISFDLELRGRKTLITGKSGSGKSYFCTLMKYRIEERMYDNAHVIDRQDQLELDKIRTNKNGLYIIDNADLIVNSELAEFIDNDQNNQYIIMTRGGVNINASPYYTAKMCRDGNKIILQYMSDYEGWK